MEINISAKYTEEQDYKLYGKRDVGRQRRRWRES
jgi:hypothetical protein